MRAAVDCQPGQSHSVGHGKRVRGGDTCRGFARVTANRKVSLTASRVFRAPQPSQVRPGGEPQAGIDFKPWRSKRVPAQQPQVDDSIGREIRVQGGHAGIPSEMSCRPNERCFPFERSAWLSVHLWTHLREAQRQPGTDLRKSRHRRQSLGGEAVL